MFQDGAMKISATFIRVASNACRALLGAICSQQKRQGRTLLLPIATERKDNLDLLHHFEMKVSMDYLSTNTIFRCSK